MARKFFVGFFGSLVALSTPQKRLIQLLADSVLIVLCLLVALYLRLDPLGALRDPGLWAVILVLVPTSLLIFIRLGFYRAVVRFITARVFKTILLGIGASCLTLVLLRWLFDPTMPRSVPVIYGLLALLSVGGLRFLMRRLLTGANDSQRTRVIIYGAGASGRQLQLSLSNGPEYLPVAFVDDNPELQGRHIGGCPVYPPSDLATIIDDLSARNLLLAMPSISRGERAEILRRLDNLKVHIQTIPGLADIVSGRTQISEISDVPLEDLLGRDIVPAHAHLLERDLRNRIVLVTGAGGSIGSELCRQIIRRAPKHLILLDQSEYNLYAIDQDLGLMRNELDRPVKVTALVGSVRDAELMAYVLKTYAVETIYHAAAYKHVPLVEENVVEGIANNVFGTRTLAEAAVAAGVGAFILISTDKAVRPTNVMGASKRLAEQICQAQAAIQKVTRFSMVRFGNVLGSSGSVIPLFRRQIAAGGPITVTHPEITRYFMTIPEAAQLVIQAGAMAQGGDVFVLDMGEPVRIKDLAIRMAKLSGLKPVVVEGDCESASAQDRDRDRDEIEICFTGLRPGEKLYEELLIGDGVRGTEHPRILAATEVTLPQEVLNRILSRLKQACKERDELSIRQLLVEAQTGYVHVAHAA